MRLLTTRSDGFSLRVTSESNHVSLGVRRRGLRRVADGADLLVCRFARNRRIPSLAARIRAFRLIGSYG
jgi:hypothetical protein